MKEIILATKAQNVYAGGRTTFMNDTGVIEKPPTPPTAQPKEQLLPVGPVIMGETALPTLSEDFGYDLNEIPHPSVRQSLEALDKKTGLQPISSWTTEELKQAYEAIADTQASLDKLEKPNSFGERDHESAIQLYRVPVLEELEARKVDIKELNKGLSQKYPDVFKGKGSIGAGRIVDTYGSADVQYFADLYNQEVEENWNDDTGRANIDPTIIEGWVRAVETFMTDSGVPDPERVQARALATQLRANLRQEQQRETATTREQQQNASRRRGLTEQELREAQIIDDTTDDTVASWERRDEALMNLIREASKQRELPQEALNRVIDNALTHENAFWYMVNHIVAVPLDAEQADYRLEYYEQNNVTAIRQTLRSSYEEPGLTINEKDERRALYNRFILMTEATKFSHDMNKQIVTGDLESFVRFARVITPDQLQILQNQQGVATVMRLFEQEFQRIMARDGFINQNNYDEIVGKPVRQMQRNGRTVYARESGSIETLLEKINESLPDDQKMEDWQRRWALNIGRNIFNMTLRTGEIISLGTQEPGRTDASIPQESLARVMNWMQWIALRFKIGEIRGGVELMKIAVHKYQEKRTEQGYYDLHLGKIANKPVEQFEYPGMFGVSGVLSGWRQENIILHRAPLLIDGRPPMSIRQYIREKNAKANPTDADPLSKPENLREAFLVNGRLRPEFNNSLGILLKQGPINASSKDNAKLKAAKTEVRAAIWQHVAQENPLAITTFLTDMEFGGGHGGHVSREHAALNTRLHTLSTALKARGGGDTWDTLRTKLVVGHDYRMRMLREDPTQAHMTLDQAIALARQTLDPHEAALLNSIRTLGSEVAPEMANVRFPFTAFVNDVVFETADYNEAGAEFYRRRVGGDLPQFNAANNELGKMMDNPGGMDPHKAFETLLATVQQLGGPQGIEGGQEKIEPFLEAYMEFTDEMGHEIKKDEDIHKPVFLSWLRKSSAAAGLMHTAGKATSLAQKYAGLNAPADAEQEIGAHLKAALGMGLINPEQYKKYKKKFGVQMGWLVAAFFRDLMPFFVAGLIIETGESVAEGK